MEKKYDFETLISKKGQGSYKWERMYKENPNKAQKTADEIIKNTYKTLMTRGMKGCYIYCADNNLQNYFKLESDYKAEKIKLGLKENDIMNDFKPYLIYLLLKKND